MRHRIPDELFNLAPFPADNAERVTLDGIYSEVAYKLPGAEELPVRKEIWHTLVDFCKRTGAYRVRLEASGASVALTPDAGKFLYVVGAEQKKAEGGEWAATSAISIREGMNGSLYAFFDEVPLYSCRVTVAVRPAFDDASLDANGKWVPKVPRYMVDRYGECIAHGALARLYMQRGEPDLARMHATAYNNDLNLLSFGLITSGMRKHLLIDIEDWLVNTTRG